METALGDSAAELESDGGELGNARSFNAHGLFACAICRQLYRHKASMVDHERNFPEIELEKQLSWRGEPR